MVATRKALADAEDFRDAFILEAVDLDEIEEEKEQYPANQSS